MAPNEKSENGAQVGPECVDLLERDFSGDLKPQVVKKGQLGSLPGAKRRQYDNSFAVTKQVGDSGCWCLVLCYSISCQEILAPLM